MTIHWNRIIAFILLVFAVVVLVAWRAEIGAFLASMGQLGRHRDPDTQVMGLLAFGLVLVGIVAVVRILASDGRSE